VLYDAITVVRLGDAGFYITAAFIAGAAEGAAFDHKTAAFGLAFFDGGAVEGYGVFIDEGPYMVFFIERVAYFKLAVGFYQFGLKSLVYAFVDDEAAGAGAALSRGAHGPENAAYERHIEIGLF
jgi:hypothetical protein